MLYLYFIKLRRIYRGEANEKARYLVAAEDSASAQRWARDQQLDPRDWVVDDHMYAAPAPQGFAEGTLIPLS